MAHTAAGRINSRCHQFVTLLRLLPAGAVAGWDFHPLESAAFPRRTPIGVIGGIDPVPSSLLVL
jgi:hypothetical protein